MDHAKFNIIKLFLLICLGAIRGTSGAVTLSSLPNTVRVPENSPATVVASFTVSATGGATVPSGLPIIINSNPLSSAFTISNINLNCEILFTGNPILDFETAPNTFNLQIYVNDSKGDTDLQILTIVITDVDEPPVFLDNLKYQAVSVYITENSPPGTIYTVLAYDPEKKPLQYSLQPTSYPFIISDETGSIISTKVFDYEKDLKSYNLLVKVGDGTNPEINGTVIVNIVNTNDNAPIFTMKQTTFTIPEEQAPGTIVANITAQDADDFSYAGNLTFSINPTDYFIINPLMGTIQVAERIDRDAKPLRDNPLITVEVSVIDSPKGGQSSSMSITFNVTDINDNPPVCIPDTYRPQVEETAIINTRITTITCTDIDVDPPNNQFKFTNLSCNGCNRMFDLNPAFSGNIVLTGSLDLEQPNNPLEYTLTVVAEDITAPFYKDTAYVYVIVLPVNENPPVFNPATYNFSLSELNGQGTLVGVVTASDKDIPFTGITYSIVAGGSTLGYSNIFWIDPNTGAIQLMTEPDYETTSKYVLNIEAVDNDPKDPKTANAVMTVNILEANNEKPMCKPNDYTLTIPTDLSPGTNIQRFQLTCTDRDSPPTAFRYTINSGNINNHFDFSPPEGSNITRLILAEPFHYSDGLDKQWNYKLIVFITDDNLLSKGIVETGTVTINVKVVNTGLTTVSTTTPPSITYIHIAKNVYATMSWYVPFIITLGAMLLLGFLVYLLYHLAKYLSTKDLSCCTPKPDKYKEPLIQNTNNAMKEVVLELTNVNTVFDGEAVDPVTGKVYEFNTKSGARRWKDTHIVNDTQPIKMESSELVIPVLPSTINKGKGRIGTANGQKTNCNDVKAEQKRAEKKNVFGPDPKSLFENPAGQPTEGLSPLPTPKTKQEGEPKPILKKGDLSEV
ncbi:cadherin-related family member 3-like [Acipenser oxyrinchus oxyrinchus]|uniref:Cadherin-related family member 3-like n=1 Tax=Acipenser oxyrinchus oxyrinchus TaxID=40147 RepID=A0AAD8DHC3_ACIOX|nr:cadherin-related family member 3-like [Acipenser oxyrinchus oxyrinchus]